FQICCPDPFAQIAQIYHQDNVLDLRHASGDPRQLLDDREFGIEADIDGRNDFLDARQGRTAQQQDRAVDPACPEPTDILEPRLTDTDHAAAQHRARDLRHPASSLGDAEDLDAGFTASPDHSPRVALDAFEIDGDLR